MTWKKNEVQLNRLRQEESAIQSRLGQTEQKSGTRQLDLQRHRLQEIRLRIRQQETATKLYHSDANADPQGHQRWENEYNRLGQKIHELAGNRKQYVAKRDVRHEFTFAAPQYVRVADGSQRRVESVEGPLHHRDTVINWRKTDVGHKIDASLRRTAKKKLGGTAGDGDAVGHRIALSAGIDPAEKRNIGLQEGVQNGPRGTYYSAENRYRRLAAAHGDQHCRLEVRETHFDQKYRSPRSIQREILVRDHNGTQINEENIRFGSFGQTDRKRTIGGRTVCRGAAEPGRRSTTPANAPNAAQQTKYTREIGQTPFAGSATRPQPQPAVVTQRPTAVIPKPNPSPAQPVINHPPRPSQSAPIKPKHSR